MTATPAVVSTGRTCTVMQLSANSPEKKEMPKSPRFTNADDASVKDCARFITRTDATSP